MVFSTPSLKAVLAAVVICSTVALAVSSSGFRDSAAALAGFRV
jgi:hypothetical protein